MYNNIALAACMLGMSYDVAHSLTHSLTHLVCRQEEGKQLDAVDGKDDFRPSPHPSMLQNTLHRQPQVSE
jgi:hypothetical protein